MSLRHYAFAAAASVTPLAHASSAEAMPFSAQQKLTAAQACDAQGNYPKVVKALPSFHTGPATGKPNQLVLDIDKSTHVEKGRLTLRGLVDYDYNATTGVCAIDPNDSGDLDITFKAYVGVNQTETPEGTFRLGPAHDTTCHKQRDGSRACVLEDFESLVGKDKRTGKLMNGNTGMHQIPNMIPAGMSVHDALVNIDTLPKLHSERALPWAESAGCIRQGRAVNDLVVRFGPQTIVNIVA